MATKTKSLIKQPRVLILLLFVVLSIALIPTLKVSGVEVSYINPDSPFYGQLEIGVVITTVNAMTITDLDDYSAAITNARPDEMLSIEAGGQTYTKTLSADTEDNNTALIGIHVTTPAPTRINLGLDLQGGARVMLQPVPADGVELNDEVIDTTISVLLTRLNMYGLQNVVLREIQEVEGNTYLAVEMAGEGSEKVVDMVKSIGKFELKILNVTVLTGDSIGANIGEPRQDLQTGSWGVPFTLNTQAASDLQKAYASLAPTNPTGCNDDDSCDPGYGCSMGLGAGMCLPEIRMVLDDKEMFAAPPAQSLHRTWLAGEDYKNLQVSTGTQEEATNVKVVLEAGRLPNQIKELLVVSQDYIDPKLGKEFLRGAIFAAIAALLAVGVVVGIRYRRVNILFSILFIDICELIIILGMAALIQWSIDLPSIAGIIMVLGTAVDQQIVITDEVLSGDRSKSWSVKKQVKSAFKIVLIAASTTIAAMFALLLPQFTGLHMLKGFAIVTILGVLIGLLITRPAYAKIAETLLGE